MTMLFLFLIVVAVLSGFLILPLVGAKFSFLIEIRRTCIRAERKAGEWVIDCSEIRPLFVAMAIFFGSVMIGFHFLGIPIYVAILIFVIAIIHVAFSYDVSIFGLPGPHCA